MTPEDPIPPSGEPPHPGAGAAPKPSSNRDDDLIEAARLQAKSPRGGDSPGGSGAPPSASESGLPPPGAFPAYEILREIHRGGQGVVYQAIQKSTKRKVAVKVMHSGGMGSPDSRERARFDREVQILGQLSHPNIVAIHESGVTENGAFFFVMDYISGQPLDAWIKSSTRTIDEALRLFAKVCDAVNAAHLKGVIHRDLKPGNIRVDQSGEPHVLDFGLAKIAAGEIDEASHMRMMTMTGQFIGSLPWASPEQAEGAPDKIDLRTDVYSLGVILYQMLTGGQFPYRVLGNMRDVLDNILRAEPARPSTMRRQINNEVETIVLKCLAKERDRRYQSSGELGRDIRRYLAGETIEAKRDSGWYVITKTLNRHRVPVAVVAAFLILLVAFAATMTVMYRRTALAERGTREALAAETAAKAAETEQRKAAESNFRAVRALARTMVTDFNTEIRSLRGATKARERILKEAREYLVKLSAGASDPATADPDLLREIADAHDTVGDLQGALYLPRIGESNKAAEAYAESRKIREALLARLPGEAKSQADMARSRSRSATTLQNGRRYADAIAEREAAIAGYERAIALTPADATDQRRRYEIGRADELFFLGDLWHSRAQNHQPDERPEDLEAKALAAFDRSAEAWRAVLQAEPTNEGAPRALAELKHYRAMSAYYLAEDGKTGPDAAGKLAQAESLAQDALADFDALASNRPADAKVARGRWLTLHTMGQAAFERAKGATPEDALRFRTLALERFMQALSVAEGLRRADEGNLDALRDEAIVLNKVGNTLRELGRLDEARDVFERSLNLRRDAWKTDPIGRHRRDLANGLFKSGEVAMLLAEKNPTPDARREGLAAAERLMSESVEQFVTLRDQGVLSENDAALREAEQGLAKCRERQASAQ